ncbi:hypothetical protein SAMD00019534_116870 [Acytostelium subglobosum LB1]|uniref:hypothetical protein n=1 Tax=Acytostelium subglobosum LB1 TaxID=1410327 RepID=UPI000644ABEF|nr:hypothetical protein SAMD00019534_116870 [Acytostelium subglobosum LB1]GAM28511.1 hypothetical protein SAMD00019534_116870 [Acytostelium subglobosum LB1]|eukprot:XP_012748550.1 hypothetical protein SAMD00019534_116870 [Acytostelium subglobosum LB1]
MSINQLIDVNNIIDNIEVSDAQIARYTEAFKQADKDGNGSVTADELAPFLRSLGQNPSDAQISSMIGEFDADKNGSIELPEFLAMMTKYGH